MVSWSAAVVIAACLAVLGIGLRALPASRAGGPTGALPASRASRAVPYADQAAVIMALYALWQYVLDGAITSQQGAFPHARWVWRVERDLHLPSEASLQRLLLRAPAVVRLCNLYYAGVHYPALIVFLFWMFLRHRDQFDRARTTLVVATALSIPVQMIPVAPPRMVPSFGVIDAGLRFGESVYGAGGRGDPGQLTAMPSVHVAWAVLIGVLVMRATRSRWRWLAAAHAVITVVVVVATGNHYWLDALAGAALVGIGLAVDRGRVALTRRRRRARDGARTRGSPEPAPHLVGLRGSLARRAGVRPRW